MPTDKRVHILYTGGTIGMKKVGGSYAPVPGYLSERLAAMPELTSGELPDYTLSEYRPLLDSANMSPQVWRRIAADIAASYDDYDGFVVIHGTDTMAYTASALSFMLGGLGKPVILTGSQIPLAEVRSDARENLITSLLLAAHHPVPEVCLYFGGSLLRGNRSTKVSVGGFGAFASPNFPPLGRVGVEVELDESLLHRSAGPLTVRAFRDVQVAALRLFPGIGAASVRSVVKPLQALVLETYGAGNAPAADTELLEVLRAASERGVVIVNCTQCLHGSVDMSGYATGGALEAAGVVSGYDLTLEAALTKLLYLFSGDLSVPEVREQMGRSLRGELTR